RPVTAIPLAATDSNPATTADPAWMPLFATPAHPEYPSGHSCVSGAAGVVLGNHFGERIRFHVTSDVMSGVVRRFDSFSAALEEVRMPESLRAFIFARRPTMAKLSERRSVSMSLTTPCNR